MDIIKEICVETFEEAMLAEAAGASRIELCANLSCGGTTPSYNTIKKTIDKLHIPVMVMIRPRGGDFCYAENEFKIMRDNIRMCHQLGAYGVVFGLLNADSTIDIDKTSELTELAHLMPVTFHKAIDATDDILLSVEALKKIGINRILSSGGEPTAIEGADTLNKMIKLAGEQLTIVVCGKVTWENFDTIKTLIPSREYHGRRLIKY
jgi:copper homeostasis protein